MKLSYSGKLSRDKTFVNWRKIRFSHRKLSRIAHWYMVSPPKDTTPPNYAEKTFANSYKTSKFAKVFSLEIFPLYMVWHMI